MVSDQFKELGRKVDDSSRDVMEPITYLSGLSSVILGYLWLVYMIYLSYIQVNFQTGFYIKVVKSLIQMCCTGPSLHAARPYINLEI